MDNVTLFCCERSNPALQITYMFIYGAGYYLYWEYLFKLLPNSYAGVHHMYYGTATVCLCLTTFVAASLSNPGRINESNAAAFQAAYPCDDVIFPEKQCSTCHISRPGRSKHCNVCGRYTRIQQLLLQCLIAHGEA
eukprot:jgi/Chrzof1/14700/Cz09g12160.t1